ncbi:hypothetical protein IAD21_01478 [Abditibacteriota bacterium]|nr:hypothetical protein IAD21_01478 [Abditibacteriota bacterium]
MTFSRLVIIVALPISAPSFAHSTTPVKTLRAHNAEVTSLSWSGDGKTLASGDKSGLVIVSDAHTGKTRLRLKYSQAVAALAFSPDSKILAVGRGREIRLLNPQTGTPVRVLKLQSDAGKELDFSSDGRKLMSIEGVYSRDDFAVAVWQLPEGRLLRHWKRTGDGDLGAALAPNGHTVAIAAEQMELWSIENGKLLRQWEDTTSKEAPYITSLAFAPDSRSVAGGGSYFEAAGHFALWNTSGKVSFFDNFQDYASALAFSPHNRLLVVGTDYDTVYVDKPRAPGGDVFLYDLKTHKRTSTLRGHKEGVNVVVWSPDGKRLASGSADHTVKIWQLTP